MHVSLKRLVVEDLFDEFTHTLDFKTTQGLTLIHGPNGTGKTTLLRIIHLLFNRRFVQLRRIPFSVIHVTFDNQDRLQITKKDGQPGKRSKDLEFIFNPYQEMSKTWTHVSEGGIDFPISMLEDVIPEITQTGSREWVDMLTDETLSLDEVLDRYGDNLPSVSTRRGNVKNSPFPEWLSVALNSVPVFLISADRLTRREKGAGIRRGAGRPPVVQSAVDVYAVDLAEKIKKTLADYADYSQTLDSTFPTRMLSTDSPATKVSSDAEVRQRYEEQAAKRGRYVKVGLLDSGDDLQLPKRTLDDAECRVLDKYFSDVELKLNQLNDLADKLELFLSIINGKFRRKSVLVDREKGLRAEALKDGAPLDLSSLSSGEQHEIILTYGLLFREKPGTLILLDEPELSLHVSWQLDLIPDLLRIADLAQLEFLIATHSPQIINDRWDLTVELSDEK